MPRYRWVEPDSTGGAGELCDHEVLGQVLYSRGIRSRSDADAFLQSHVSGLPDPGTLPDADAAVELIRAAINNGDRIAVFGDYDVDGVSSTAVLVHALCEMGAQVMPLLPHRERDGYGLNTGAVDRASDAGCRLLITVDCGSGNQSELEHAASLGMKTVVIDHHHVMTPDLPCNAFVSPKRPDSAHEFDDYAAVGVTYQVLRHLTQDDWVDRYLPIVALGTVADVVPLTGPNRSIVYHGLARFAEDAGPGPIALAEVAGVKPDRLTSHHFGFLLGPRLNAAGRIDDPWTAYELLKTDSPEHAASLAKRLNDLNQQRQRLLEECVKEARIIVESNGASEQPVLVVHSPDWRIGLVGLIASRLSEQYKRPVFALEQGAPFSRGSARSIDEFNVVEALEKCSDLLQKFGGHSKAAGLTIETNRIDDFSKRINDVFLEDVGDEIPLPPLTLDAELAPELVSLDLTEELSRLEPCGHGNPQPVFLMRDVQVQKARRSRDQSHLLFDVAGYPPLRAVSFGGGERLVELNGMGLVDLAVSLRPNTWRGRTSVTLEVVDFRPARGQADAQVS